MLKMESLLLFILSTLYSLTEARFLEFANHIDNTGNAFCISFLENGPSAKLLLHIFTDESEAVEVNIHYSTPPTGNITSILTNVSRDTAPTTVTLPSDLAISPASLAISNAVSIHTSDSSKSIAVVCENTQDQGNTTASTSSYLALPIRPYKDVFSYQYSHFSDSPSEDDHSMFVLSNCDEDDIVPSLRSPPELSGILQVPDIYQQFINPRSFIENRPTPLRRIETFESLHFANSSIDASGIQAWADKSFSFVSGLSCSSIECKSLSLQIPPSYTWGYSFVTIPHINDTLSIEVKALPVYDMTLLSYHCNDGTNGSVILTSEGYLLKLPNQTLCSFISGRPIGLVQILHGSMSPRDRTMIWLTPMEQFIEKVTFASGLLNNGSPQSDIEELTLVTVPAVNFDPSLIVLDGNTFLSNNSWNAIMCSAVEVCAYTVLTRLPNGKHTLHHTGAGGHLSVYIVSTGAQGMSSYSTGFRMDPIGVPVISFTNSLYIGSESHDPFVTLSRRGDLMTAIDVLIKIDDTPHHGAIPSNRDFHSFNETVHFNAGQLESMMTLRVRDDLRVESAENFTLSLMATTMPGLPFSMSSVFLPIDQAILQINDNDLLVLGFTVGSVRVSEELESVTLTLRSSIPLQDSGMNVLIQSHEGTANDTLDYTRLENKIFLSPGESEWEIEVPIVDDNRVEETEHFFITVEVISTSIEPVLAISEVQINISDTDNIIVHFAEAITEVQEEGVAEILLKKVGANDFPIEVLINTEDDTSDDTAEGGIDYKQLRNLKIKFEPQETEKSFNVTILPDSILETDETFILRLSRETDSRVDFSLGTRELVSITDDDVVEIGFNQTQFSVIEGNGVAILTVEILKGKAERSFFFHVETFQQQAEAGLDFEQLDTDLEFPSFHSFFQFNITILDNKIAESSSEGFTVSLTSSPVDDIAVTVSESARTTVVTIKEDDNVLIMMDLSNHPMPLVGREGGTDLQIRLYKANDIVAVVPVEVDLVVEETFSTATENGDFTTDDTVTFSPNENEKNISIQFRADDEIEGTETFTIILYPLSGPVSVDLTQELTVMILDAAAATVVSVEFASSRYTVNEGEQALLTLTITGGHTDSNITVILTTTQETANGIDFSPLSSQIVMIPSNVSEFPVSIQTFEDQILENSETFTVSLQLSDNQHGVTIGPRSTTTVTITDNDALSISFTTPKSFLVPENIGNVTVSMQITGTSAVDIPLIFTTNDYSTQGRLDYHQLSDSAVIPAGTSVFNLSIMIVDDNVVEQQHEVFSLRVISLHPRITVADNDSVLITIADDDELKVEFDRVSYTVAEDSAQPFTVRLIAMGRTDIPLYVSAMTVDGTAKSGEDYAMFHQLLMFNQSITEHQLVVNIMNDRILEGTQTFFVELETIANQSIAVPSFQAMVEIYDGNTSEVSIAVSSLHSVVLEDKGPAIFNISIVGRRETDVYVTFNTKPSSAIAYNGYLPVLTTIVLSEEDTHSIVSVVIVDDEISEMRKTFYGTITTNLTSVAIETDEAEVVIKDDEGAILSIERSSYVVDEGETVSINVVRSVDVMDDIELSVSSIDILTEGGGVDYDFNIVSSNVTIPAGSILTEVATVVAKTDSLYERHHETFEVKLTLTSSEMNDGALIINNTAIVSIVDQDVLIFTGVNAVVNERNSSTEICFSSNIPSVLPIQLQFAINGGNEVSADYNITQTHVTMATSHPSYQISSFCISFVVHDRNQDQDEHLCLMTTANDSTVLILPNNTTEYCPSNMITITIRKDAAINLSPVCYLKDSMVVPFPKSPTQPSAYKYSGHCEHVILQQCSLKHQFTINAVLNRNDLSISTLAIQLNDSLIIVNASNLTYTTTGFTMVESIAYNSKLYDGSVLVLFNETTSLFKINILNLGIDVELLTHNSTIIVNATRYNSVNGEVCGLCGTIDGVLLYSDTVTQLDTMNTKLIEDFSRSWIVTPEDQITGDSKPECNIFGNDTVVGDPLFSVPIYPSNSSLMSSSLCFEVHGASNKVFNLVSDRCVSVNGLYFPMNNPSDGNIITSLGVKAVNNAGRCINILVSLSTGCIPSVNSNSTLFYSEFGVSVRKHGNKVIVSVPNCENEQLVMWLMCRTIEQQRMLDFTIRRGLNLRPTSHGLLGQFWNIPVQLTSYHTELPHEVQDYYNPDNLYLVTVQDPLSHTKKRQFIGEMSKRSWNKSLKSCIYVGSSQGGRLSDIPGPKDTVIEGLYIQYIIEDGGLLGTNFAFSKFDSTICRSN